MTPRLRLEKVEEKRLCKLCFCHLAINECWAKGKTPNCQVKGCGREHNHLLHDAIVEPSSSRKWATTQASRTRAARTSGPR
jgi:hypothetical protein